MKDPLTVISLCIIQCFPLIFTEREKKPMSFSKEKPLLLPLTPLSKKQKVNLGMGVCKKKEMQVEGISLHVVYICKNCGLQCSVMLLWRAVSCDSSPCQQDSSRIAAQGRLAVQGKLILLDGLNRMRACYCPSFPLFSSPSWFSSDFTQNFSF